ncbi:MAG: phage tail family protein [Clostridia bacterium]|nr:phage tail family protein [Clostridia bacterium]
MVLTNGELSLSLDGALKLISLEVGGAPINNFLCQGGGMLGGVPMGFSISPREVKIEGYVCEDLEANRKLLCQICTQTPPFYIVDGDYRLELLPKHTIEFSSLKRFSEKLLKFTIRAISPSPYWLGEAVRQQFYNCGGESTDDIAIRITNTGDVEMGALFEFLMMSSCNFIKLIKGEERIFVNHPFKTMDKLFIDTRHGKMSVCYLPSGQSNPVNIIEFVSPDSSFFGLDVGENRFDFVVSQGLSYVTIEYSPAYLR